MEYNKTSLKPYIYQDVPKETERVAKTAFPKGNKYINLRNSLGSIYKDENFSDLFPSCGQPAMSPWRLALVVVLQFVEGLSDRQAADAVRGRIDWKYLLALDLTDSGFDYSILSEFRKRLLSSKAEGRLLSVLLEHCKNLGVLKGNGKQRTDSTHVLSRIRDMNRLELIGETMRAALNEIATLEADWIRGISPQEWYQKYDHRIENSRLPDGDEKKQQYAKSVGEDGFRLFDAIKDSNAPTYIMELPKVKALKTAWDRHFSRDKETLDVTFKTNKEVSKSEEKIESPYDIDARFRTKRDTSWTGYMVHLTETCDNDAEINIITHVRTTPADVHDVKSTKIIQGELYKINLAPKEHIVDTAYINLDLLVSSKKDYNIDLIGPPKEGPSWRSKVEGAYTLDMFKIDWDKEQVTCPQGKVSSSWNGYNKNNPNSLTAIFSAKDCRNCTAIDLCVRDKNNPKRKLNFPAKEQYLARKSLCDRISTNDGKKLYNRRAGVEGTISQGVRNTELRQSRYFGLQKTHLQEIAGAVAINLCRLANWIENIPLAKTRESVFARLKPMAA
jgi:transposase